MFRQLTFLGFCLLFVNTTLSTQTVPEIPETIHLGYSISSNSKNIGTWTIDRTIDTNNGEQLVKYHSETTIIIKGFLFSYDLHSSEQYTLNDNEHLLVYNASIREGSNSSSIKGSLENDSFVLKTIINKQDETTHLFQTQDFALTSAHISLSTLPKDNQQHSISVLDFESVSVKKVNVQHLGKTTLNKAGKNWECEIYHFTDDNGWLKLWLCKDKFGTFSLLEQGKDEDGPFIITLETYHMNEK